MTLDPQTLRGDWHYPTEVHFGAGRIAELPAVCRALGITRPLLITDPGLVDRPMCREVVAHNIAAGLPTEVFAGIRPNPVGANVADGRAAYRAGGHDGVVALGGGSVLDVGKVVALLASTEQPLWDIEDLRSVRGGAPIVAVPTTAGTGSEVGRAAVVTHAATHTKRILLHPGMLPARVIADPALTRSLPSGLTAATGMDALAHCLEAYCAPFYHPMADGIALEGLRLLHRWLPVAYHTPDDLEARAHVLAAALMGATAFQKGLGAIHALSHPLGARYDLHHGLTNAIVLPYVLVFNRPAIEARMGRLARYLGLAAPTFEAALKWMLDLRTALDLPHTLADVDVPLADLDTLAQAAADDPCAPENPVPVDVHTLKLLFHHAHIGHLDV